MFSCKRWKHSRPPVRIILAWKNGDEKIEASSEERGKERETDGGDAMWGESIWFEIAWRGRTGESFYFCLLLFEDKVK